MAESTEHPMPADGELQRGEEVKIILIILAMVFCGVCNRLRGSDLKVWPFLGRLSESLFIGLGLYHLGHNWSIGLIGFAMYWIGQSFPWGHQITTILEDKNGQTKAGLYLTLVGAIWFGSDAILCAICGAFIPLCFILGVGLSVGFPIAFETSKHVDFRIPGIMRDPSKVKMSYSDRDWEEAEFIYGLIQGLCLGILFLC